MFKIGEFSRITQVSIRMLRYYDEQGVLKPADIDPQSGYRLYTVDQITTMNRVTILRNIGFPVSEISALLDKWDIDGIERQLQQQIEKLDDEIKQVTCRRQQAQSYLKELTLDNNKSEIEVIMKSVAPELVLSLRRVVPDYYCESDMWEEFGREIRKMGIVECNRAFSIYHDLDYREESVDIEICMVLERPIDCTNSILICRQVDGVEMAASFLVYGPYSNISREYRKFAYWMDKHNEYEMSGENRQICLVAGETTNNQEEYITELLVPLKLRVDSHTV